MNRSMQDSDNGSPGMLIALIVILVLMAVYLGYLGIKGVVSGMTEKYTDTSPIVLPETLVAEEDVQAVLDRVEAFVQSVEANDEPVTLSLSARDINILINHHPDWSDFAGKVHVRIEGEQLHGRISMPLKGSRMKLNGRYLNGNGIFRIGLSNGQPEVFIESLEMNGEQLPNFLTKRIYAFNLLSDAEWDAGSEDVIRRLETFNIQDDRLNIVVGPRGP